MRNLAIVAFFTLLANGKIYVGSTKGYIKMEYLSKSFDKPFHTILFYLPTSIDTTERDPFLSRIKICEKEFSAIENIVKLENRNPGKVHLEDPIQITIVKNQNRDTIKFIDVAIIKKLSGDIIGTFNDVSKKDAVRNPLNSLLRRIGVINYGEDDL